MIQELFVDIFWSYKLKYIIINTHQYQKFFCRESWRTRLDDDQFEYEKEQQIPQSISELNQTSEMVSRFVVTELVTFVVAPNR